MPITPNKDPFNRSPLMLALLDQDIDKAIDLIKEGCNLYVVDDDFNSFLHYLYKMPYEKIKEFVRKLPNKKSKEAIFYLRSSRNWQGVLPAEYFHNKYRSHSPSPCWSKVDQDQ